MGKVNLATDLTRISKVIYNLRINSELKKTIEEDFSLLRKVLVEASAFQSESDERTAFIYRHAGNIYRLGQDVVFLLEASRLDSCPIIVRAMLESLFKLVAAVNKPEAVVQILIYEFKSELELIKTSPDQPTQNHLKPILMPNVES